MGVITQRSKVTIDDIDIASKAERNEGSSWEMNAEERKIEEGQRDGLYFNEIKFQSHTDNKGLHRQIILSYSHKELVFNDACRWFVFCGHYVSS
jgi:hypothetical protein